jgi:hypothetical protein
LGFLDLEQASLSGHEDPEQKLIAHCKTFPETFGEENKFNGWSQELIMKFRNILTLHPVTKGSLVLSGNFLSLVKEVKLDRTCLLFKNFKDREMKDMEDGSVTDRYLFVQFEPCSAILWHKRWSWALVYVRLARQLVRAKIVAKHKYLGQVDFKEKSPRQASRRTRSYIRYKALFPDFPLDSVFLKQFGPDKSITRKSGKRKCKEDFIFVPVAVDALGLFRFHLLNVSIDQRHTGRKMFCLDPQIEFDGQLASIFPFPHFSEFALISRPTEWYCRRKRISREETIKKHKSTKEEDHFVSRPEFGLRSLVLTNAIQKQSSWCGEMDHEQTDMQKIGHFWIVCSSTTSPAIEGDRDRESCYFRWCGIVNPYLATRFQTLQSLDDIKCVTSQSAQRQNLREGFHHVVLLSVSNQWDESWSHLISSISSPYGVSHYPVIEQIKHQDHTAKSAQDSSFGASEDWNLETKSSALEDGGVFSLDLLEKLETKELNFDVFDNPTSISSPPAVVNPITYEITSTVCPKQRISLSDNEVKLWTKLQKIPGLMTLAFQTLGNNVDVIGNNNLSTFPEYWIELRRNFKKIYRIWERQQQIGQKIDLADLWKSTKPPTAAVKTTDIPTDLDAALKDSWFCSNIRKLKDMLSNISSIIGAHPLVPGDLQTSIDGVSCHPCQLQLIQKWKCVLRSASLRVGVAFVLFPVSFKRSRFYYPTFPYVTKESCNQGSTGPWIAATHSLLQPKEGLWKPGCLYKEAPRVHKSLRRPFRACLRSTLILMFSKSGTAKEHIQSLASYLQALHFRVWIWNNEKNIKSTEEVKTTHLPFDSQWRKEEIDFVLIQLETPNWDTELAEALDRVHFVRIVIDATCQSLCGFLRTKIPSFLSAHQLQYLVLPHHLALFPWREKSGGGTVFDLLEILNVPHQDTRQLPDSERIKFAQDVCLQTQIWIPPVSKGLSLFSGYDETLLDAFQKKLLHWSRGSQADGPAFGKFSIEDDSQDSSDEEPCSKWKVYGTIRPENSFQTFLLEKVLEEEAKEDEPMRGRSPLWTFSPYGEIVRSHKKSVWKMTEHKRSSNFIWNETRLNMIQTYDKAVSSVTCSENCWGCGICFWKEGTNTIQQWKDTQQKFAQLQSDILKKCFFQRPPFSSTLASKVSKSVWNSDSGKEEKLKIITNSTKRPRQTKSKRQVKKTSQRSKYPLTPIPPLLPYETMKMQMRTLCQQGSPASFLPQTSRLTDIAPMTSMTGSETLTPEVFLQKYPNIAIKSEDDLRNKLLYFSPDWIRCANCNRNFDDIYSAYISGNLSLVRMPTIKGSNAGHQGRSRYMAINEEVIAIWVQLTCKSCIVCCECLERLGLDSISKYLDYSKEHKSNNTNKNSSKDTKQPKKRSYLWVQHSCMCPFQDKCLGTQSLGNANEKWCLLYGVPNTIRLTPFMDPNESSASCSLCFQGSSYNSSKRKKRKSQTKPVLGQEQIKSAGLQELREGFCVICLGPLWVLSTETKEKEIIILGCRHGCHAICFRTRKTHLEDVSLKLKQLCPCSAAKFGVTKGIKCDFLVPNNLYDPNSCPVGCKESNLNWRKLLTQGDQMYLRHVWGQPQISLKSHFLINRSKHLALCSWLANYFIPRFENYENEVNVLPFVFCISDTDANDIHLLCTLLSWVSMPTQSAFLDPKFLSEKDKICSFSSFLQSKTMFVAPEQHTALKDKAVVAEFDDFKIDAVLSQLGEDVTSEEVKEEDKHETKLKKEFQKILTTSIREFIDPRNHWSHVFAPYTSSNCITEVHFVMAYSGWNVEDISEIYKKIKNMMESCPHLQFSVRVWWLPSHTEAEQKLSYFQDTALRQVFSTEAEISPFSHLPDPQIEDQNRKPVIPEGDTSMAEERFLWNTFGFTEIVSSDEFHVLAEDVQNNYFGVTTLKEDSSKDESTFGLKKKTIKKS